MNVNAKRALPFILTAIIIIIDQLTKAFIVANIPLGWPLTIYFSAFDGFFQIIHVRNPGVIFSIGANLPDGVRTFAFSIIPLIVLVILITTIILTPAQFNQVKAKLRLKPSNEESFTPLQRWALAIIIGGGIGNIIDRIFRPDGVVDFIDIRFFGLSGLENIPLLRILSWQRFPTFNIADSAVTIGVVILLISFIQDFKKDKNKE
ncbi:MAG: signal peptidase II [Spirochaetaceae bacterium]|nr:signal peptidase II [Spirochaetaceae bacterium]